MSEEIVEARVRYRRLGNVLTSSDPRYKPRTSGDVTLYAFPNLRFRTSPRDGMLIVDEDTTGQDKEIWIGGTFVISGRDLHKRFFPLSGPPPPPPRRRRPAPHKPLSVVVNTYDRPAYLEKTLAALLPRSDAATRR